MRDEDRNERGNKKNLLPLDGKGRMWLRGETFHVLRRGFKEVQPGAAVTKAGHSERLMKRDSEVLLVRNESLFWTRARPCCGRQPVIEHCCCPIVKLHFNSFSIIITICFPCRAGTGGWERRSAAELYFFFLFLPLLFSLLFFLLL